MPNYNAKENSNNFGLLGAQEAGRRGGLKKGENKRKRMEEMRRKMEEENNEDEQNETMEEKAA